jgi:predicted TIM-barrel fold metal-dependent hydrolase
VAPESFASLPIVDAHVHFVHPERMEEMLALLDEAGCERANLVCLPNHDGTTQNAAALYFKERYPERVYISGALEYGPALAEPERAADILAAQIPALKAQGFDGLKLIEGKPEVRPLLPYPLDGPLFDRVWAVLEQENFPVVFHVADPPEFWDPDRCPEWARARGWDYAGGGFPSRAELYGEVEHILQRYPRLKLTLAHFYFLSAELERAADFLDEHPSVCFDLAPHIDMYRDFNAQPEAARRFFLRFADRIVYGTDLDTRVLARGPEGRRLMQSIPWLVRSVLEREGEFLTPGGAKYHGLGLPQAVLEKIYSANFEARYSPTPQQV